MIDHVTDDGYDFYIASEWLPSSGYLLADRPEIVATHWYRDPDKENRYMELWVPVEKKAD